MYDFLISNPIITVLFVLAVVAITVFLIIKYVQYVGLEKIRKDVYDGFRAAERRFNHGENDEKFKYVVQLARSAIPYPYNFFINERLLRKIIQSWFRLCKDFLDDLKLNGTGNDE